MDKLVSGELNLQSFIITPELKGEPNQSGETVFARLGNKNGTWFDAPGYEYWTSSYICLKDPEMIGVARKKKYN